MSAQPALLALGVALLVAAPAPARDGGTVRRVEVAYPTADGASGNQVAVSGSGRYVVYTTTVAVGGQPAREMYVLDRASGRSELVSADSRGRPVPSGVPDAAVMPWHNVSDDGRWVTFPAYAQGMVAGEAPGTWEVFLRDRVRRTTTRINVDAQRHAIHGADFTGAYVSADGSTVVFLGECTGAGVDYSHCAAFAYDTKSRRVRRIARDVAGESEVVGVSRTGRWVAFSSFAPLTADDHRRAPCEADVFVTDTRTGATSLVTGAVPTGDAAASGDPCSTEERWFLDPAIDDTGRHVTFSSLVIKHGEPGGGVHQGGLYVADRATGRTTRLDGDGTAVAYGAQGLVDLSGDGHTAVFWSLAGADEGSPDTTTGPYAVWLQSTDSGARARLDPPDATHPCTAASCAGRTEPLVLMGVLPTGGLDFPYPVVSRDGRVVVWPDLRRLTADDTDERRDLYVWTE